jgi:UrcA family protein
MNTPYTRKLAIGLLVIASAWTVTPGAQAQTLSATDRTVTISYTFNAHSTPEKIYTDLERVARNACERFGVRPLKMRQLEAECTEALVSSAVQQIDRPDIAQLHSNSRFAALSARRTKG